MLLRQAGVRWIVLTLGALGAAACCSGSQPGSVKVHDICALTFIANELSLLL